MIGKNESTKFEEILMKEKDVLLDNLANDENLKLSDLVKKHYDDIKRMVKIKRIKNMGGYEYVAFLLATAGIETTPGTLKTTMWRIENSKIRRNKKSNPSEYEQLEQNKGLTDQPPPNLSLLDNPSNADLQDFKIALNQNHYYFRDLPDDYHDHYGLGFEAVAINYVNYNYLSMRLKENTDIAHLYLMKSRSAEGLVPKHRSDRLLMLKAVKLYNRNYYRISDNLKRDKTIAEAAIKTDPTDSNFVRNVIKIFEDDTDFAKFVIKLNYRNKDQLTPELKEELKDFLEEEYKKRQAE